MRRLIISNHARKRYAERFPGNIETLEEVFRKSKKLKRLDVKKLGVKHKGKGREYRRHYQVLIAINSKTNIMITVFEISQQRLN